MASRERRSALFPEAAAGADLRSLGPAGKSARFYRAGLDAADCPVPVLLASVQAPREPDAQARRLREPVAVQAVRELPVGGFAHAPPE
jgi:hypothetical protein